MNIGRVIYEHLQNEDQNSLLPFAPMTLAWSPDSTRLVSAGVQPQVWDIIARKSLYSYNGHDHKIANAFDVTRRYADALRMATEGYSMQLEKARKWPIKDVAWSPNGTSIASIGNDGVVHVWNATTRKRICTYRGQSSVNLDSIASMFDGVPGGGAVNSIAWSPDSTQIASGCGGVDDKVQIWEADTGKKLLAFSHHDQVVAVVAWSPDGTRIASVDVNGIGLIQHVKTRGKSYAFNCADNVHKGLEALLHSLDRKHIMAWSPDGTRIASIAPDTTVHVWQAV